MKNRFCCKMNKGKKIKLFKSLGKDLNYSEVLEVDGALSICHINYGKSPIFNGKDGKEIAVDSRRHSFSSEERIDYVIDNLYSFDGTEINIKKKDKEQLWKSYWLEYINAFDKLTETLPDSIVTLYIGRHAIEIGIKYLLIKKSVKFDKTHNLYNLFCLLRSNYKIKEDYMDGVDLFCELFCDYIEGGNVEYFRFPEYNRNTFFAGNRLDIGWLSYNLALIILKLLHLANLDDEIL